jgi:hypothetical protein
MPEFLFEASHINEVPVCIKGCTLKYGWCYSAQELRDCSYTHFNKRKKKQKRKLLLL